MHDSMQLKLEKLEQRINEIQELLIDSDTLIT